MSPLKWLELTGTLLSIIYLVLLIKEHIYCWIFGILASAISIYILIQSTLYAEASLSLYYVLIGFYGWWVWAKKSKTTFEISQWSLSAHFWAMLVGVILGSMLGFTLKKYTDATNPFADAYITIFSFIASYKEAHKILSGWVYWFFINGATVMLYTQRSLYFYAFLGIIYTAMTVWGYWDWKNKVLQSPKS